MKIFYALENIRSLKKTPKIELRPITILVGRNSAGKSTFLRSLALLRQSIEARSSAPILWYGDYVDFGDFTSAVSQRDTTAEISFDFTATDFTIRPREQSMSYYFDQYAYVRGGRRPTKYSNVNLTISLGEQLNRTVRRTVKLEVPEHKISLVASFGKDGRLADSFTVNGVELSELLPGHSVLFDTSDIFSSGTLTTNARGETRPIRRVVNPITAFTTYVTSLVKEQVDKRILSENIDSEARNILRHPSLTNKTLKSLEAAADTVSFKRFYASMLSQKNQETLKRINIACAMYNSLQTLSDAGDFFRSFFSATTYLGPARARSERYYRFQELEVSEIAPDGHNLPMFLGSLPPTQLANFSDWVHSLFGFGVGVQRTEGHISIQLKRDKLDVNVADTGYGVSQLLPVLAQIWWSSKANYRYRMHKPFSSALYPITMEQPELHLHPAHQAQLADALLNALPEPGESSGSSPVFIVETHSETLINRLGELIEEKKLKAEDVQIVIFSTKNDDSNSTVIDTSEFGEDGSLINWPYGFFSY